MEVEAAVAAIAAVVLAVIVVVVVSVLEVVTVLALILVVPAVDVEVDVIASVPKDAVEAPAQVVQYLINGD